MAPRHVQNTFRLAVHVQESTCAGRYMGTTGYARGKPGVIRTCVFIYAHAREIKCETKRAVDQDRKL